MNIKRDILSLSLPNVPGYAMTPKYITIHNTANTDKGANAASHAGYLRNGAGGRQASWHYTVDDKQIVQHIEDNRTGWHAGDGSGPGNRQSIGVEICENSEGDFEKAVENAAWLVHYLMDKHNLSVSRVVTHKKWSGKDCPRQLLSRWDWFIAKVTGDSSPTTPTNPSSGSLPSGTWSRKAHGHRYYKEVEHIQAVLASIHFYPEKGAKNNGVDGWYGAKTEDCVRRFQLMHATLANDGIFGPLTKAQLEKEMG